MNRDCKIILGVYMRLFLQRLLHCNVIELDSDNGLSDFEQGISTAITLIKIILYFEREIT